MAIKINYKELEKDWEKIIFGVILSIVFILFIVFIITTFFSDEPAPESNVAAATHHSLFNSNAFAFLSGIAPLDKDEVPFNYRKLFHQPRLKRPPRVNFNPNLHQNPKPPPKQKPEKQGHIIYYNGWITLSNTGKKLAFIKIHDLKTGKLLKSDSVGIDNEIFDYKILDIDEEEITIRTPEGKNKKIPIHKNIKIMIK